MISSGTTLDWRCQALQDTLQTGLPALQVQALGSVDSTSTRLLELLRQDATPRLLVAETQTQGRGRNGRVWFSAPGASLTFSLALPYAPVDWSGLSLAVGVALGEALEPLPPGQAPRLQLKWPNDLWLCDAPGHWRKLGGILIETVATGSGTRACVVGVGLNVLPRPDLQGLRDLRDLSTGHACVQEIEPTLDAPGLLWRVAPALVQALVRFETQGLEPFAAAFARRDLLRGQAVATTWAAAPTGQADGVDAHGALRVQLPGGAVVMVSSGEVSVRPLDRSSLAPEA